jgi:SOS response regulatory protein OraA/RecX
MTERDPIELAARSLRHRDRSRRELDARLARAGVDEDARADALDEAIRLDLKGHQAGAEAIEAALGALEPEAERAAALVERLGRTRKVAAQLTRKGFGQDALEAALGAEIAEDDT